MMRKARPGHSSCAIGSRLYVIGYFESDSSFDANVAGTYEMLDTEVDELEW